ncbi:unnamed protein product [Lactuca virosa]|uniref:Nucleoside diphosphate kinase-like domain-containing protein n=1 Tax=Lactuca virosa TaxID=75947 RepID=A0AAU9LKN4_9ASTR|nr:unnamed protein product [Lactuca virosa]
MNTELKFCIINGYMLRMRSFLSSASKHKHSAVSEGRTVATPAALSHFLLQMEQTFIAIKPDGVQRGLILEIIARFERLGRKRCD